MMCNPCDKFSSLVKFLRENNEKAILFLSTGACVEYFALILSRLFKTTRSVFALYSKKAKRGNVFESFRKSSDGKFLPCCLTKEKIFNDYFFIRSARVHGCYGSWYRYS